MEIADHVILCEPEESSWKGRDEEKVKERTLGKTERQTRRNMIKLPKIQSFSFLFLCSVIYYLH